MIPKLINEMNQVALAMTEATQLAREANTREQSIVALRDMSQMIVDLDTLHNMVVLAWRKGL